MATLNFISEQAAAGWLLILSGLIFIVGGGLYWGRAIQKWQVGKDHRYLLWERGFIITSLVVAVLGLNLLQGLLEAAGDRILAPSGMALMLIGGSVILFSETFFISRQEWVYAPTVTFVVLAFLAQALFGASLLRTGLLSPWIGWATISWNLGWLVILPIARPKDIYYPWLHYTALVLIGIALLMKR